MLPQLALPDARNLRLAIEAGKDLSGLADDLLTYSRKLRAQPLEARMVLQENRRLFSDLRLKIGLCFTQPLDNLGADHFGKRLGIAARLYCRTDILRPCLRVRPLSTHPGKFGRDVVQLLCGETAVVCGLEEPGGGPIFCDLGFRSANLLRQRCDFRLQPPRDFRVVVELGAALQLKVHLGHLIWYRSRKLRVLRGELDRNHARILDRVDLQLLPELLDETIFGRKVQRILLQSDQDQGTREKRLRLRAELIRLLKTKVACHLPDQIGGAQQFRLTGDIEGIEHGVVCGGERGRIR